MLRLRQVAMLALIIFVSRSATAEPTILHAFGVDFSDGANPIGGVSLGGTTLYGVTDPNAPVNETLYAVETDGSSFRVLHSFNVADSATNGRGPALAPLIVGDRLYGLTSIGALGSGTLYSIKVDGTDFDVLHAFTTAQGRFPAAVVTDGSTIYGLQSRGGSVNGGTLYSINIDGSGFRVLHDFAGGTNDFRFPGALVLQGSELFGTATDAGPQHGGGIFAINTDGTNYGLKHLFTDYDGAARSLASNGTKLFGALTSPDAIYSVNYDGSGFEILHSFTSDDGFFTVGNLAFEGNKLYGMTQLGGLAEAGTAYRANLDGSDFETIQSFNSYNGSRPTGSIVVENGLIYGVTMFGGPGTQGEVFALPVPEPTAFAMMTLGAIAVGGIVRRRRTTRFTD